MTDPGQQDPAANPPAAAPGAPAPQMDHYRRWLREHRGLEFADYTAL